MLRNHRLKTSSERLEEFATRIEQTETFDIEGAKFDVSEHIFSMMERQGVSKAKLARRMGKSRPYVTRMLQGNANFTLESLVKIARALECRLDIGNVLIPIHQATLPFDWSLAQRPIVRTQKVEHDYIKLVEPLRADKEKDNAPFATAA
ncbi:MAG TPA: helix-turn-helix transcriptional regulator [Pyrinomonadaceae bacterium]|jgi:transcriptional regulator with XRE-family HTH domain|nr:helix-turn-helix transcriptional regulator [Pyrinomonadaceae bacterium]